MSGLEYVSQTKHLVQAESPVPVLGLIKSIGDTRTIALVENGVVHGGSHDATNNRSKDGYHKVVVCRAKDFSSIHDGRE